MAWVAKKFRLVDCQSVSVFWHITNSVKIFLFFFLFTDNLTCFCLEGLGRAVGGRRFLEVLVLCHSVRHNVFMETICEQPKASSGLNTPTFFLTVV